MVVPKDRMQAALEREDVDAIVATSLQNVYYSTGVWTTLTITPGDENYRKTGHFNDFSPPRSLAVWAPDDDPALVAPPNVATHIPDEDVDFDEENVLVYGLREINPTGLDRLSEGERDRIAALFDNTYEDRAQGLTAALAPLVEDGGTLALEGCEESPYVREVIEQRMPQAEIVEGEGIFQRLRMIKTDEEIERLRRGTEINETAIEESLEKVEEGMTEIELATIYKQKVYEKGALEQIPVEHTMIGFGPHSAYSHVVPSERQLEPGDLIRFEVGCRYCHYGADLARTYIFQEQDDDLAARYEVLYSAIERCRALLATEENAAEIYRRTVDHLRTTAREYGVTDLETFDAPMIGHNMGLDLHDPPLLAPREAPVEPGMVMNFEFNSPQWGIGSVQLEDTVLVTEDGVEAFSRSPESLRVVE